jgi:hypothetical protein
MAQNATRARPPPGEPPALTSKRPPAYCVGHVPTQVFQATQLESAMHAALIWSPQPPASAASWAGPLRHVRHAVVGFVGVAAQMFERHWLPQGPGAAVVPQPHDRSVLTNVS